MKEMEKVLHKISESGLKVNAENSFFVKTKTDYLSFWVSKKRVRPLFSKLYPINPIEFPTKVCGVHWFLGIVNYYRYMWSNLEHTLSTLTKLCYTKFKLTWADIEQKYFIKMKK